MKRILSAILCAVMLIGCMMIPAVAEENVLLIAPAPEARDVTDHETCAVALKQLGLFMGVSDTDFDLERAPTRIEALVMLIRVLGEEEAALNGSWEHPFTDVPVWDGDKANKYVGYAYENGLTNGMENGLFNAGKLLISGLIASFGTIAIAANSAAYTINNLGWVIVSSFSTVMLTVVGQCVGANEPVSCT